MVAAVIVAAVVVASVVGAFVAAANWAVSARILVETYFGLFGIGIQVDGVPDLSAPLHLYLYVHLTTWSKKFMFIF